MYNSIRRIYSNHIHDVYSVSINRPLKGHCTRFTHFVQFEESKSTCEQSCLMSCVALEELSEV